MKPEGLTREFILIGENIHTTRTLLRGGKTARHWNHQMAANRLGVGGDVERVTANRLAMIYEHARYTPPQEALPAAQLDLARRDLVALAGAAKP